jgi:hypothetical protein
VGIAALSRCFFIFIHHLHSMTTSNAFPLLHSMGPEITAAQQVFNRAMDNDVHGALKQATQSYNRVLERAFEAMLLDMKSRPTGHLGVGQSTDSLRAIHSPGHEGALWFGCEKPEYTAVLLANVARTGEVWRLRDPFGRDPQKTPSAFVSDDFFLWRLEKSLRAGDEVVLGPLSLRKAQRGDVWTSTGHPGAFKALEDGLFVRLDNGESPSSWIHAGPFSNLELVVQPHVSALSREQIQAAYEQMLVTAAKRAAQEANDSQPSPQRGPQFA